MIGEYEITVDKLLKIVHRSTEIIKIHVVSDIEAVKDKVRGDFFITKNFAETPTEIERVLKYYADVPVWNLHIEYDNVRLSHGHGIIASIVANCHYKDMREGFLREKNDLRKERQKEYRRKRKENV